MKPRPFDYVRPETVDEAVTVLAEHGDGARVLAGGQSLMAMLNLRLVDPGVLVDIARIPELDAIRDLGDKIEVGAAVTQNKLMNWPDLSKKLPLLAAALPHVGHFQTRNKGTICGSIAQFCEVARRHGDFAIIAVAAVVEGADTIRLGVGGMAGRPQVRRIPANGGAQEAVDKLASELEGYEDLHASAALRRDILRNLAPIVIAEAQRCAA